MSDKYADYQQRLQAMGYPTDQVTALVQAQRDEDAALDQLVCIRCSQPLTREASTLDEGPSAVPGTWYKYRCMCGYALDRKEGIPDAPQ